MRPLKALLTKVANDYKSLQAQAAALNPENPMARGLITQAKAGINTGHLAHAHELLRQATQAQIAATQEAHKVCEQAQTAEGAQLLGATASTATEGGVAMTERHYGEAADPFKQAAGLVPGGLPDETSGYLARQANALYRQGDELGDNRALMNPITIWKKTLQLTTHRMPLDWATTQTNLGTALWALGESRAQRRLV